MTKEKCIGMIRRRMDFLHAELTKHRVQENPSAWHYFSEDGIPIMYGMSSEMLERLQRFVKEYNTLHWQLDELLGRITN